MVRIRWNVPAFEKIRRDPALADEMKRIADDIADRCGEGYVAVRGHGVRRDRAAVITTTGAAMRDNAENNTILRSLGGAS